MACSVIIPYPIHYQHLTTKNSIQNRSIWGVELIEHTSRLNREGKGGNSLVV